MVTDLLCMWIFVFLSGCVSFMARSKGGGGLFLLKEISKQYM